MTLAPQPERQELAASSGSRPAGTAPTSRLRQVPRTRRWVLVTDAGQRSIVATCRGLAAAGYAVSTVAFGSFAPSQWSRHCEERLRVSDPRLDARAFIADLRRCLSARAYDALIPGSDYSLLAISRDRRELEDLTALGLPPHQVVQRSLNRQALAAAAASAGLHPPASVLCTGLEEAVAASASLGFPLLVKSISTATEAGPSVTLGATTAPVSEPGQLAAAAAAHRQPFLLQRAETGRTLSFGGVMAGEQLIGVALSVYQRTWPVAAGNVAFSATIAPPADLESRVERMLAEIGWEGMFEIELIERADGGLVPIDLNPRPYGSMALAIAAGANLPGAWCNWMLDGRVEQCRALPGRRYRWEDGDVKHLLWQLRHGNYRAAASGARPRRGVVHPFFAVSDPLPLAARGVSMVAGRVHPGP